MKRRFTIYGGRRGESSDRWYALYHGQREAFSAEAAAKEHAEERLEYLRSIPSAGFHDRYAVLDHDKGTLTFFELEPQQRVVLKPLKMP